MGTRIVGTAGILVWCALGAGVAAQAPPPAEIAIPEIPGIVGADTTAQLFGADFEGTEGPIRTPDGGLIFTEHNGNRLNRIDPAGNLSLLADNTERTAGLAYDPNGDLVGTAINGRKVVRFTPTRTVLADNYQGQPFIATNDLVADRNGGFYFTDPILNLDQAPEPGETPSVYYLRPSGEVVRVTSDVVRPNGVMLSPDEQTLYVGGHEWLVAFDVEPDATLTNRRNLARLEGRANSGRPLNCDGIIVDSVGRLYVAAGNNVQIFTPEGSPLGIIPVPAQNMAFAGADLKTLWVVGRGNVYSLPTLAEGLRDRAR